MKPPLTGLYRARAARPSGVSRRRAQPTTGKHLDSVIVTSRYPRPSPAVFAEAADELDRVRVRPEVHLEEVPAPTRIAPDALALSIRVGTAASEDPLATGRFVLLHDPDEPEAWGGSWRVVCFAHAGLEPEFGDDPMLAQVGWSWLIDSLVARGVEPRNIGGTVTRVLSEGFGQLSAEETDVDLEIRASWSPRDHHVGAHLAAWCDLLSQISGLPPVPVGLPAVVPGP